MLENFQEDNKLAFILLTSLKFQDFGNFLGGGGLQAVLKSEQYLRLYVYKSLRSWCDW